MATSSATPYELIGAKPSDDDFHIRSAYRTRVQEFTRDRLKGGSNRKISPEKFRLICRAYETLADHEKKKQYDLNKSWRSNFSLSEYTLQQLAAEPDLFPELKKRLEKATLRQINAQDPNTGHTTLYCAARACNVEAVYYLVDQGADPDLETRVKSTALHVSSFYDYPEMVRCLLECGADYRKENNFKNLPEKECSRDDVKQTFVDLKKMPFIQVAANQLDWLRTHMDSLPHHIDEQYYRQRQTLLHCASKKGYEELVRWLIDERSANLDIVDINLNSALHLAAYGGHKSMIEYLLNKGANPLLVNKWGMTPEQESIVHGRHITTLFRSMRSKDIFKMASEGILWWFEYYFNDNSPDLTNDGGASLLYIACRCGKTSVVQWLLEHKANVNIKLQSESRSTPLHTAAFHGYIKIVELLLANGADVNIQNSYHETVFQNAKSEEMKKLLSKYRDNLKENKILTVHLYGDGKKTGNEPLAKLQLSCDATYDDLYKAMPADMKASYSDFSIARRPLAFRDDESLTVISAVCQAQCGKTKYIELPLCITAHERARYTGSGHVTTKEVLSYNSREFHGKFSSQAQIAEMKVQIKSDQTQIFTFQNLSFTFAADCVNKPTTIEVQYIISPDVNQFSLPGCVCLFQTRFHNKNDQLNEMPIVSFQGESQSRLYSWIQSTPYWIAYNTRHIRLPFISGIHAFIRYAQIIPQALTLLPDMFIQAALNKPFSKRENPVYSQCLKIREHNSKDFPLIAYHGTNIKVIPSILMDGLVMPSTVVSNGFRVCPPPGHIARDVEAFDIKDFANGIFVSPSIYYCSDPVYAVTFNDGDRCLIAVLECSVKENSFTQHPSTVPDYKPHPTDNIKAIEWRLTNPAAIEIISILFIPVIKSRIEAARLRAEKLGVDPKEIA